MAELFRILQEALTNVARHARGSRATINLRMEGAYWVLEIEDDGGGISAGAMTDPKSLGLLGMRERAAVIGGDLAIFPVTPHGTRLTARIPNDPSFEAPYPGERA
jgi:two-component system, NarL family, sensor histidine kinase UhpB